MTVQRLSPRLYNWASIVEAQTRQQAERTASMPFIHPHVALMPDCHLGAGSTVGSVIPTLRAIIPAAVGVDIVVTWAREAGYRRLWAGVWD